MDAIILKLTCAANIIVIAIRIAMTLVLFKPQRVWFKPKNRKETNCQIKVYIPKISYVVTFEGRTVQRYT